eukprot:c19469_g1_i1 orf=562-2037(-)
MAALVAAAAALHQQPLLLLSPHTPLPPPTFEAPRHTCSTCWIEARNQYRIAGYVMINSLLQSLFPVVAVMFVGHLGERELAGVSLANSFYVVTCLTVMLGLGSGLETLCGQAYGARQYHTMGSYLQAAVFVLCIVAVPLAILWFNMETVFSTLGQEKAISSVAGKYMKWLIPSIFANAILQPLLKFLQSQSSLFPATLCTFCASAIHIPLCYLLVFQAGMGITGGALAVSLTSWLNLLFTVLHIVTSKSYERTWTGLSSESLRAVKPFLKLAVPSAIMICLEYWSFEILILLGGILPDPELQTSLLAVCVNTETLQYMLPFGLAAAASTRVANELGAGDLDAAKFSVKVAMVLTSIQSSVIVIFFLLIRNLWGWAFSSDIRVVHEVGRMMPLVAVSIFLDGIQGVLSGVARGCGWQHIGAYTNLFAFYCFGMPMGILLAFKFNLNSKGLWSGLSCGILLQTCILLAVTMKTNWVKMAEWAKLHCFVQSNLQ